MIYHIRNKITGETWMNRRGQDYKTLPPGFDNDLQVYYQFSEPLPSYNANSHFVNIKPGGVWTNESHPDYSHLKKYIIEREVKPRPLDEIVETLNETVGDHIDAVLKPGWDYQGKLLANAQAMQMGLIPLNQDFIDFAFSLMLWAQSCRDRRDLIESQLIETGELPADWDKFSPAPFIKFEDYKNSL